MHGILITRDSLEGKKSGDEIAKLHPGAYEWRETGGHWQPVLTSFGYRGHTYRTISSPRDTI